jgi:co-chaperonin GroES (HSP10)
VAFRDPAMRARVTNGETEAKSCRISIPCTTASCSAGKWSGTEVKIDREELLIVTEADILGIVDATAAKSSRKAASIP